jgi:predicted RNA-binding Zn ribbon-like protein
MRVVVVHPVELVLPGEPPSVRLMNTTWADRDGMFDGLRDGDDVRVVLAALGRRAPRRLSSGQVGQLRDLRAALRALADAATGSHDAPPTSDQRRAAAAVNAALAAAPVREVLQETADGWALRLSADESFAGSLGLLAREGTQLIVGRADQLLRRCPAPSCGLYFTANHARRQWCSTACADRVRAARYYRRHHRSDP